MEKTLYIGIQLIAGIYDGKRIRPSNWYERILEFDMLFDRRSRRFHYSGFLQAIEHPQFGMSVKVDFDQLRQQRLDVYEEISELIFLLDAHVVPLDVDQLRGKPPCSGGGRIARTA